MCVADGHEVGRTGIFYILSGVLCASDLLPIQFQGLQRLRMVAFLCEALTRVQIRKGPQ